MADLSLVPVERLTSHEDRFRCDALRAAISVRTCLTRRAATYSGGRNEHEGPADHALYPTCQRCPVGAELAQRITLPRLGGCEVCGAPSGSLHRRAPRCPKHRRSASPQGREVPRGT